MRLWPDGHRMSTCIHGIAVLDVASMRLWPDGHRMGDTTMARNLTDSASMRLWPDGHRMGCTKASPWIAGASFNEAVA